MDRFLKPEFSKIVKKDQSENISTFTLEKLERGFGNTIGNSMRRAILSSVPGVAPFAINIKGVSHEFQAIKDTKQDVVEVILNLKELLLKVDENIIDKDEVLELRLISKKGLVKAGDIETPIGIEIANKDLVIAETTKDKAVDMTIYAIFSKGYKTFDETRILAGELLDGKTNIIPMDANFSPVSKVNVTISEVNPGEDVIYERLTLEVETKGNMLAEKAVAYAASVLKNYYIAFEDMFEINADEDFIEDIEEVEEQELAIQIDTLNLSTRSENALLQAGINTVEELIDRSAGDLKNIDNLGSKSIDEIIELVKELGLSFKAE